MLDLNKQKLHFKNHIATLTDYGNVKILDFKNPNSIEYRIRFLFDEDYHMLHISGDLGELTASNYCNMTYEKFSDFVNNAEYFESKVDCHSRPFYTYDEDKARVDIINFLKSQSVYDVITSDLNDFETEEEVIEELLEEVFEGFDDRTGISFIGYEKLEEAGCKDVHFYASDFGKERTGIIEIYMLAFKLAKEQLDNGGK